MTKMMRKINTTNPDFIYSYSMSALIDEIGAVNEDAEVSWNSFGGSVYAGQKFIDFLNNQENELTANVTGIAASMGASILPFFNKVIGSKQADVMIHSVTGGPKSTLKQSNEFLYNALSKKIDSKKFKEVTGKDLKEVMLAEGDERVDVWMTGAQAAQVGLFDEAYDLLEKSNSLEGKVNLKDLDYKIPTEIAKKYSLVKKETSGLKTNITDMDLKTVTAEILKKENSAVYDDIVKKTIDSERARVSGVVKYAQYDPEKVNEIINSGRELSTADVEYFMEKKYNKQAIVDLENGSEDDLNPANKVRDTKPVKETKESEEKKVAISELREILGTSGLLENDNSKISK